MRISPAGVTCCLLVAAVVLGGCRQEEQGRVMLYQKGVYLGQADSPLSDETRESLRRRTNLQRVTAGLPGGG